MAKYNVVYDEFKDRWLRDDPKWVEDSKKLLKQVLKNKKEYRGREDEALYIQQFKHYFIFGERLRYPDLVVRDDIGALEELLCIPWSNKDELESVFYHGPNNTSHRQEQAMRFAILSSYYLRGLPDQWPRIQLFCDVIFGEEYKEVKVPERPGSDHLVIVSPDPVRFVDDYISCARDLFLKGNGNSLTWLNCAFDYFCSCMSHLVEKGVVLDSILLNLIFECFEYVAEVKPEFDRYQQDIFDKLNGYMMSEEAPKFIVEFKDNYSSED